MENRPEEQQDEPIIGRDEREQDFRPEDQPTANAEEGEDFQPEDQPTALDDFEAGDLEVEFESEISDDGGEA